MTENNEAIAPLIELTEEQKRFAKILNQISSALKPYGLMLMVDMEGNYSVEKME